MRKLFVLVLLSITFSLQAQNFSKVFFGNRNDISGAPNLLVEDSVAFSEFY